MVRRQRRIPTLPAVTTSEGARSALPAIGLAAAVAYMVLMGGTVDAETHAVLRLITGVGGAAVVLMYVLKAPRSSDAVDRGVLLALLLFAAAGVLSAFPRQSLDAVLAALAFVAAFWLARDVLRSDDARRRLVLVLVALSAIVTLIFVGRWVVPVLGWWEGTGWSVVPPLNLSSAARHGGTGTTSGCWS